MTSSGDGMPTDPPPPNPWLSIPASDYEAHMSDAQVGQLQYLSAVFARALARHHPLSIACLGCTTGNGFEHLPGSGVRRVVAVDVNPQYLEILQERHGSRIAGLTTLCADLVECKLDEASFDLVWAGLVFEYVDVNAVLEKVARWLRPRGVLSVVLQLPSPGRDHVTATPIASVRQLEPFMKLVEPKELERVALRHGLQCEALWEDEVVGKGFLQVEYRKR